MALNTTPATVAANDIATAALWNTEVRDALTGIQAAETSYSPTWTSSGTNPVLNNGSITALWTRVGKMVDVIIVTALGSTTTIGTGIYSWTLPATARLGSRVAVNGGCIFTDASASLDLGGLTPMLGSTTTVTVRNAAGGGLGATVPVVPAVGDLISIAFRYEAA